MSDWVDRVIDATAKLGNLPSAAVWALMTVAFGYYIYISKKQEQKQNEVWQGIRLEGAKAEASMAEAVGKMVDTLRVHSEDIRLLKTIIQERLPMRRTGDTHV